MLTTDSVILYHGPSSQTKASLAAQTYGRIVGSFGHPRNGLTVDVVREALKIMTSPHVGDGQASVVIGPIDILTQEGIVDIFLKSFEERIDRCPRPYLWAWDLMSVRPTIQSRCLLEWCPGQILIDKKTSDIAKSAIQASLSGSIASLIEAFEEIKDQWKEEGGDFLIAVAQVLSTMEGTDRMRLWSRVRDLRVGVSWDEALAGFLL